MSVTNYLFSFKGRINRAKFWLIMIIPICLIGLGLLIGGILVAQSMISSAKIQKTCRDAVTSGSFTGNCSEAITLYRQFQTQPAHETYEREAQAYYFCKDNIANFPGAEFNCDQYMKLFLEFEQLDISKTGSADENPVSSFGLPAILGITLLSFLLSWVTLAVYAKRLHDYNLSGWWQIAPHALGIMSVFGTIIAPVVGALFSIASFIAAIALFVICGFLKGTTGPNKYGADPLQK